MTIRVISLTWQVMFGNGQQKQAVAYPQPPFPKLLVPIGEAFTATAAITRAIAATPDYPTAVTSSVSVHFYICRTGRSSRNLII